MTPSKRTLPGRPLPSTSLPKALLKKAAAAKPAPPKPSAPRPAPKPVVATPSPTLSKEATAAAALSTFRSPGAAMPKSVPTARPAFARSSSGKGNNKWGRRAAITAVVVLLCVGGAWAFFFRHGDPIAKIESLQAKMDDKNLSWDDRRALSRQVRDQERKLSPDERDKLRAFQEDRRGGWGEARLTSFFAKSPAEQTKDLDKQIDDMMKRQQSGNGFGRGGGFRGGGGGGAGGNSNAGRNRRLSSTPADVKAQRTIGRQLGQVYQNMLTDRASQRGITLPSGGPRG